MTNSEEWLVYKHTSPSGKVYIGITHQKPEARWMNGKGYKYNKHFWSAIQKYGWDNFDHEIVGTGLTKREAEEKEKLLVKEYKSSKKEYGYNVAEGGHVLSEESRKRIGQTRRERGIKPHNTGKHLSEETKKKISLAHRGKTFKMSETAKRHISEAKRGDKNPNYGKPMLEQVKRSLLEINEKPVIQVMDGTEMRYRSAKEAGDRTGIASCNITRVCRGQRMTAGGYSWRYANWGG